MTTFDIPTEFLEFRLARDLPNPEIIERVDPKRIVVRSDDPAMFHTFRDARQYMENDNPNMPGSEVENARNLIREFKVNGIESAHDLPGNTHEVAGCEKAMRRVGAWNVPKNMERDRDLLHMHIRDSLLFLTGDPGEEKAVSAVEATAARSRLGEIAEDAPELDAVWIHPTWFGGFHGFGPVEITGFVSKIRHNSNAWFSTECEPKIEALVGLRMDTDTLFRPLTIEGDAALAMADLKVGDLFEGSARVVHGTRGIDHRKSLVESYVATGPLHFRTPAADA